MSEAIEKTVTNDEITKDTIEKTYTLRELYDEDIYPVVEILGKVLPESIRENFSQVANDLLGSEVKKTDEQVGGMVAFDILKHILKNFSTVKDDVYAFLSSLSGIPSEEIKKMPFGTTPKMLKEVFTNPNNASFFKELSKLF